MYYYYYKYEHHCDHDVTLGDHAPHGRRHVVPSAVSLADVYASRAHDLALAHLGGAINLCTYLL